MNSNLYEFIFKVQKIYEFILKSSYMNSYVGRVHTFHRTGNNKKNQWNQTIYHNSCATTTPPLHLT